MPSIRRIVSPSSTRACGPRWRSRDRARVRARSGARAAGSVFFQFLDVLGGQTIETRGHFEDSVKRLGRLLAERIGIGISEDSLARLGDDAEDSQACTEVTHP